MAKFKKGDRVKVTLEGHLRNSAPDDGFVYLNNKDGKYIGEANLSGQGVTIEKLPDLLPTAPGSVIRSTKTGMRFFLVVDPIAAPDSWVAQTGTCWSPNDLAATVRDYEVVFDAGAAS